MTETVRGAGATVRAFEPADIPDVARLFLRAFRKGARPSDEPTPHLTAVLRRIYFDNPWYDPEIRSQVFADETGAVRGFIGVTMAPLVHEGRRLRAAFAGSLTVEDPVRHPLAGARLIRSFLSGPQDLSLTETANATAMRMWQKLGIPFDTQYSLNWLRLLRPVSGGTALVKRRLPIVKALMPLARLGDAAAKRFGGDPFRPVLDPSPRRATFATVSRSDFDAAVLALAPLYSLRPDWDQMSLDWFSSLASVKRNFGEPRYRVALGRDGRPRAAYAYFHRPDDFGWLLQSLTAPAQAGDLVDDLLTDAYEVGCCGMRGAAQPWLTNALMSRRTLFLSRTFFLAQARDQTLLTAIRSGDALVSGLAGESWMPLIGDSLRD
ncbi:hypothetical protein [Rhizobium sp. SAFR-030]|uniref:hypothetical protein n=1 Tax=Rhizobium sp. SAFR-030 TaxID=3387277 RepID=UPI003F80FFD8